MKSQVAGLRVAAIVFGLMAAVQVTRLLFRAEILVNGHQLPLWASALAAVFVGGLCIWLLRLSSSPTRAA